MPAPAYFTPVSEKNNENCENHKANNNVQAIREKSQTTKKKQIQQKNKIVQTFIIVKNINSSNNKNAMQSN